jgi:hypothetical protein
MEVNQIRDHIPESIGLFVMSVALAGDPKRVPDRKFQLPGKAHVAAGYATAYHNRFSAGYAVAPH